MAGSGFWGSSRKAAISNQQSAISNQQSAISNQQSAISNQFRRLQESCLKFKSQGHG
jgi:hypothetical protein